MTDYRFLAKRTDAFVELLSEALIGWNTCFTVKDTIDAVFEVQGIDLKSELLRVKAIKEIYDTDLAIGVA